MLFKNMKSSTTAILRRLRAAMANTQFVPEPLQAYIVPSSDAHNSEYLAYADERRSFVTGFDGSAGTAIIAEKDALLWTDGRYHLQASQQIDANWTLMRDGLPDVPTQDEWLCRHLPVNAAVGADPFLLTWNAWRALKGKLDAAEIRLVPVPRNLVDLVWEDRLPYPENLVFPLEDAFSGRPWHDKVSACRRAMAEKCCACLILSALDDIAWLLNLRGSDISFNPVFFAYVAVTRGKVHLFISEAQVNDQLRKHLQCSSSASCEVVIEPYLDVIPFIEKFAQRSEACSNSISDGGGGGVSGDATYNRIWFSNYASYGLVSLTGGERQRLVEVSPATLMKAVKNPTELRGFAACHERDAAALCRYFAWLEKEIPKGHVTELSGADELERLRSQGEHFVGLSFPTISSAGPNGAIIHYRPTAQSSREVTGKELYLVDSGAQYKDGTTDVTRTLHFGTPTKHERECFTRVLRGQMALARAVFPNKTKGFRLDTLARQALWDVGLDYAHGTGHGVGAYLNVHEGPMGISYRPYPDDPGLQEGMILSDEPGYYEDGAFGIRLETLVRVVRAETQHNFQNQVWLTFEAITLVPIQRKMIVASMLTVDELKYLNDYHQLCRDRVGPRLREFGEQAQDGLDWLQRETEPLG